VLWNAKRGKRDGQAETMGVSEGGLTLNSNPPLLPNLSTDDTQKSDPPLLTFTLCGIRSPLFSAPLPPFTLFLSSAIPSGVTNKTPQKVSLVKKKSHKLTGAKEEKLFHRNLGSALSDIIL
jgi:hypothetical protein